MKTFHVATVLLLLTGPASAQAINLLVDKPALTPEQKEKQKEVEDAYRTKMNQIPDQKGLVRPVGQCPERGHTEECAKANAQVTSRWAGKVTGQRESAGA